MTSSHSARSALAVALVLAVSGTPLTPAFAQAACSSPKNDLFKNPFNKRSAHHRPIGTGAVYAADNHPATRSWLRGTHLNINVGTPSGTGVVEVDTSDPLRTITGQANCDRVSGMPVSIRLPRNGFITNTQRAGGGCADNVVVVYDRTINKAHQLRQYNWRNGRPTAQKYTTWDIRGLGHGTRRGENVGTAASGVAALFGVLRGHEINTPGHKIEHALHIGLPRKPGRGCNVMLSDQVVLPATNRDRSAGSGGNNGGAIPYGGLLALKPSVNIASLNLSEPGRRLAAAIQNYGMYVINGGGCNAGAIDADQNVSAAVKNQLRNDIRKIYPHVRLVLNNNVMGSPVAGGGSPRAPNCAFDS
jgi:hypothetical protein